MPTNKDQTQIAAEVIRNTMKKLGTILAPSHASELTAAYMGFSSKKALIDSGADLGDPELVLSVRPDLTMLGEKVMKLRPDMLQKLPLSAIGSVIKSGLTPPCECCGIHFNVVVPIPGAEHGDIDGWVCTHCADREDAYGACRYCGDKTVYRSRTLNRSGECPMHAGESNLDPEEEAGFNDLAQYWQGH